VGINTGALYIIFIMLAITGFAYITSGPTPSQTPTLTGPEVVLNKNTTNKAQSELQLYNFNGVTITPPIANLCTKGGNNKNPDALIAYSPAQSTAVSTVGQISLWVTDNKPPYVAPNEQASRSSGAIKLSGERDQTAPDGYRFEPQLYIFPHTVETNGKPYYPDFIRGDFNNGTPQNTFNSDVMPTDALPKKGYTVEFIWNVANIGLTPNEYEIEFVAHDGNENLGVKCINIRIYAPSAAQSPGNELPL